MTAEQLQSKIKACQQKDPQAQKWLVDHFASMLYAICLRYATDDNMANDILQESFIRIFRQIKKYNSDRGSLQAWLKKITIHTSLNYIKKYKGKTNQIADLALKEPIENPLFEQMDAPIIIEHIQRLPEQYRSVFNLHVMEGYSHSEISEVLNIKTSTSRTQLTRAKKMLRASLQHLFKTVLL